MCWMHWAGRLAPAALHLVSLWRTSDIPGAAAFFRRNRSKLIFGNTLPDHRTTWKLRSIIGAFTWFMDCRVTIPARGSGAIHRSSMAAPLSGCTAVVGHTPTPILNGPLDDPYMIWHGNGIIGIDCGCEGSDDLRKLACLRLEDLAEFYA